MKRQPRRSLLHSNAASPRVRNCQLESLEARVVLSGSTSGALLGDAPQTVITGEYAHSAASVNYPGGVIVTDTQILTEHETIPRFVAQPTISTLRGGSWSDPSIWSLGRVPTTGDRVSITANASVSYNLLGTARLAGLEINGQLSFSTSQNTRLTVGNLTVMPTGTLQIGTPSLPVARGVKAELVIADQPLNLQTDPSQYGTGLIALGTVSIHGAPMDLRWDRLTSEPRAGDTSLLIANDAFEWRAGDTLVLPDTRQVLAGDDKRFPAGQVAGQWEQVTIDHIVGNRVYLTSSLQFNHLGARNTSGGLELLPHVALLTRNVVVRSENPQGTRGHVLFTARADVDIEGARFQDLGRTDAFRNLNSTTIGANGQVTHLGTNQVGRYAVHFHHLMGPENPTNTGHQFTFTGNTVDGALKWAVAVHDASYGLLQNNVIYRAQGAGFVTEEGSEIYNEFLNNITIRIQGTSLDGKIGTQEDDYGRGGSGFWFRYGGNAVVGNVAADSTYAGFVIDGYYGYDSFLLPDFRGADPHQPGQATSTSLTPTNLFSDNEAYGMTTMGLWAAYISGDNFLANQPTTVFDNLRLWNMFRAGVEMYHTSNVTFNNLLILGDRSAQTRNDTGLVGLSLANYENRDLVITNSRIEGARWGIIAPRNDSTVVGKERPTVIENTTLKNYINIRVSPTSQGEGNSLVVRNVRFELTRTLPTGPALLSAIDPPANIQMRLASDNPDLTKLSVVRVYAYNGVTGDDFQVLYREQTSQMIMPKSSAIALSGLMETTIGSPQAGLTNAQNWSRFAIAVAGSIAPANAATRADINGLTAPLQNQSSITPRAVLVTPWDGAQITGSAPLRIRYNVNGTLPAGTQVYLSLDGKPGVLRISDHDVYYLAAGTHTLTAYIGNSTGQKLAGTQSTTRTFTISSTFGAGQSAAAQSQSAAATTSPAPIASVANFLPQTAITTSSTVASNTSPAAPAPIVVVPAISDTKEIKTRYQALTDGMVLPPVSEEVLTALARYLASQKLGS